MTATDAPIPACEDCGKALGTNPACMRACCEARAAARSAATHSERAREGAEGLAEQAGRGEAGVVQYAVRQVASGEWLTDQCVAVFGAELPGPVFRPAGHPSICLYTSLSAARAAASDVDAAGVEVVPVVGGLAGLPEGATLAAQAQQITDNVIQMALRADEAALERAFKAGEAVGYGKGFADGVKQQLDQLRGSEGASVAGRAMDRARREGVAQGRREAWNEMEYEAQTAAEAAEGTIAGARDALRHAKTIKTGAVLILESIHSARARLDGSGEAGK